MAEGQQTPPPMVVTLGINQLADKLSASAGEPLDDRVNYTDSALQQISPTSIPPTFIGYDEIPATADADTHRFSQLPTITLIQMMQAYIPQVPTSESAPVLRAYLSKDRHQWRVQWRMPDGTIGSWEMMFNPEERTYTSGGRTGRTFMGFMDGLEHSLIGVKQAYAAYATPGDTPTQYAPR